ncbi:hypothetical protein GPECTOR_98g783 [Gonium pectorale]|uniref:Uncharacterized protein n=1 Tax=Gonium pectorale TaxID=33097 RepID=A0A150G024_GONPE|nr:hypothetical protein GPECTOR_98g783 [Gonium pectorale]|eukprot:KXZ43199.1 hypothetical protein GPECTOR_98g783 [Gonium pectorale]
MFTSSSGGYNRLVRNSAYTFARCDPDRLACLQNALQQRQNSGILLPTFVGRDGEPYGHHELEGDEVLEILYYVPSSGGTPVCCAKMVRLGASAPIGQDGIGLLPADTSSLIFLLLTVGGGNVLGTTFPYLPNQKLPVVGSVQLMPPLKQRIAQALPDTLAGQVEADGWPVAVALGLARGGTAEAFTQAYDLVSKALKTPAELRVLVQEAAYYALVQPPPAPLRPVPVAEGPVQRCLDLGFDDEEMDMGPALVAALP